MREWHIDTTTCIMIILLDWCITWMALTHSLIHWSTFLLWRLMTADDHSQTICLHSSLSTVNAFSSIYLLPVHSFMSFNHDIPGCPWWRVPAMLPSSTVSVIWPVLLLAMWPNYCSFTLVTLIIRYQSVSSSSSIDFVRLVFNIFLQLQMLQTPNASILSDVFIIQLLEPQWKTAHTMDFITWTFDAMLTFLSFQTL